LGGYTTFSSFEWETLSAVHEDGFWIGLANVVGGVAFGYANRVAGSARGPQMNAEAGVRPWQPPQVIENGHRS